MSRSPVFIYQDTCQFNGRINLNTYWLHEFQFTPDNYDSSPVFLFAYLFGVYLIITAILILVNKHGRKAALVLGAAFLLLFLFDQGPGELEFYLT